MSQGGAREGSSYIPVAWALPGVGGGQEEELVCLFRACVGSITWVLLAPGVPFALHLV